MKIEDELSPEALGAVIRVLSSFADRYEGALDHVEMWSQLALGHPEADENLALEVFEAQETAVAERKFIAIVRETAAELESRLP